MRAKYKAIDDQLLQAVDSIRRARAVTAKYSKQDWLDSLKYGLLFGTPEEVYRVQSQAMIEAEKEGRPFTPVFWTASEAGAEPVLTLWRIG
jgi:hypothetical protein